MNQRLLTGVFALAISLALVGAAVNATQPPDPAPPGDLVSLAVPPSESPGSGQGTAQSQAEAQVPFRTASLDQQDSLDVASPVTVRVGAIGLEAGIQSVGVDDDNLFDVPEAQTVGWYKYGSAPLENGSTVLAAHVDYGGRQGAFFNLATLAPGDELEVELADGTVIAYEVTDTTLYDKTALPADDLFRKDGPPVLRLITCGGTFDQTERSYRGNVVVTAVPLEA